MTRYISLISIFFVLACTEAQKNEKLTIGSNDGIDTLSRVEYESDISSERFGVFLKNKNSSRPNEYYNGDTLVVTLMFASTNELLSNYHTTEIRPVSKNISLERTDSNKFRLIIDSNNIELTFSIKPYIRSNRIIFEDSYFDSLGIGIGPKYSSSVSSFIKTYPVELKK